MPLINLMKNWDYRQTIELILVKFLPLLKLTFMFLDVPKIIYINMITPGIESSMKTPMKRSGKVIVLGSRKVLEK